MVNLGLDHIHLYVKDLEENLLRQPDADKVSKELFGPLIAK